MILELHYATREREKRDTMREKEERRVREFEK